ncbi:MAG: PufQ cytochrome subunit [Phormidesmis priestleyi Ana]|uniref:PufQ cytochrome subunit n=1 Tax=Phormidesmis priestleyi Ana TaxID=1666911 RepID=A0A0P7ZP34_9CYAN|nr:MAG: PufQ cytochrome subunit [Phormidesmis priestleyi Ana]
MDTSKKYRMNCTLTFGDIYSQIIVWLIVLFVSLAAALGLMGASRPIYALATVGLILVLSLPFLLFAFVTTLLNHIEFNQVDAIAEAAADATITGQAKQLSRQNA